MSPKRYIIQHPDGTYVAKALFHVEGQSYSVEWDVSFHEEGDGFEVEQALLSSRVRHSLPAVLVTVGLLLTGSASVSGVTCVLTPTSVG